MFFLFLAIPAIANGGEVQFAVPAFIIAALAFLLLWKPQQYGAYDRDDYYDSYYGRRGDYYGRRGMDRRDYYDRRRGPYEYRPRDRGYDDYYGMIEPTRRRSYMARRGRYGPPRY